MPFFDIEKHTDAALKMLRNDIINMAERSAHVAVALSCVDIIAALYFGVLKVYPKNPKTEKRDRFILSKGHGCMALYAVLARRGFFDLAVLESYCRNGSILAEHPLADKIPGIEFAAGTLGHGLPVGAGIAKSLKLKGSSSRVFILMGDGECDEGTVWEAAAVSSAHKLDNLTVLVDWNGFQACDRCKNISGDIYLPARWSAFGWDVEEVDGHDYHPLVRTIKRFNYPDKPRVIFCKTLKGKGIDFMENNLEWHYRPVRGKDKTRVLRRLFNA